MKSKKVEENIKEKIEKLGLNCKLNDNHKKRSDYDLIIDGEFAVEIKNDIYASKSGNVAIEYFNPKTNKPSGISITKSHIWCHIINGEPLIVLTENLRDFVSTAKPKKIVYKAGDKNADLLLYDVEYFKTILVPLDNIKDIVWQLKEKQQNQK